MKDVFKVILAFAIIGALIYFTISSKLTFAKSEKNLKINNLPSNDQIASFQPFTNSTEFTVFLKSLFGLQKEDETASEQETFKPQSRGYFADITGDGQKDWLYWEYSPGASGWSNHYKIYQFIGFVPKKIFDFEADEDYTEFYQQEIISRSLYWGDAPDHAEISQYKEIIFDWNGTEFAKTSEEIKSFTTGE